MNPNTPTRQGDGIGCECCAHSLQQYWTPSEVYELQDQLAASKAEVMELSRIMVGWKQRATMSETDLEASKAEIKEIRNALGDDGRRTHKEILEMAFKASGWREWKKKYIDLRNAHIAEGQDPAGTIWEHADKLQKEIKETKAEVERLKKELADWDYGTRAEREQKRAEKAEAELSMWRDGGIMHENHSNEIDELKAEVERLRSVLQNLTDAVTKRLSDDFQPEAARQLWEAFKVASETLDKR
jgi:peptidoglycan hydrolase CwlO-like protein